jgi:hypothetical protein
METGPGIGYEELRTELSKHKSNVKRLVEHEDIRDRAPQQSWEDPKREKYPWGVWDSPLNFDKSNDSPPFEASFGSFIPQSETEHQNLGQYIERYLADRQGNALGVEFGGPARRLFSEFTPGFFKRTAGVTFSDPTDNPSISKLNSQTDHCVISGDIFASKTMNEVENWFEGQKVDFIIERLYGGHQYDPGQKMLFIELNRWYRMLREGGVMLIETPGDPRYDEKFKSWVEKAQRATNGSLEIIFKPSYFGAMQIKKLQGAPESLTDLQLD